MKVAALTLALAATAYSQNLTEALAGNPDLTNLTRLFAPYTGMLANLQNITLLAPNNAAIDEFLNTSSSAALNTEQDLVSAILSYHVLNGTYNNFTNVSFIRSALQPGAYANVTGGQRVEALGGANTSFISGLFTTSSVTNTTNFTGGIIHVVNRFLTLPQNISATAIALGNLTSAVGALTNTSLANAVDNTRDVTCFIPNNAAFQRIGGNIANLSTAELASILQYHVVPGVVGYSTDLANGTSLRTLNGANVTISIEGSDVFVDSARVIRPNVLVRNGVAHIIDRVLNPSNTTAAPNTATTEEAFAGATSASDEPFTSGVPTPTSSINTEAASSAQASAAGSGSSSSSGGAWRPIETGAIGMAALFGGAAAVLNM